jgi:hypothetical protein
LEFKTVYLLVALQEGKGTYHILFLSRFWCKNAKKSKKISHCVAKTFLSACKGSFYPVLVGLSLDGRGGVEGS